ncbi:MerR family transcriptional regulator [Nocardia sp. NPDC057663]|uniref:MerR family transcriptional regulator n=1 Tax=Nocardia sp. NPDC057663 TaxID=3346201 RepID=UPI003671397F
MTSKPTVPAVTSRSAATSGRIPAITNSPVVMLKTQNMRMASRRMPVTLNSHVDVRVKSNSEGNQVRIGELADRTGVSVRALRYYEEKGVLRPDRTASGYRIFTDSDIHKVSHIQTLLAAGLGMDLIGEILACLSGESLLLDDCHQRLEAERSRITDDIDRLVHTRSLLDKLLATTTRG